MLLSPRKFGQEVNSVKNSAKPAKMCEYAKKGKMTRPQMKFFGWKCKNATNE